MAIEALDITWKGAAAVNFAEGRGGTEPDVIVLHIMAGTIQGTEDWFHNPAAQVSAHYGIAKTGAIHQYVDEKDTAYPQRLTPVQSPSRLPHRRRCTASRHRASGRGASTHRSG